MYGRLFRYAFPKFFWVARLIGDDIELTLGLVGYCKMEKLTTPAAPRSGTFFCIGDFPVYRHSQVREDAGKTGHVFSHPSLIFALQLPLSLIILC